jgi:hypothetical protein
MRKADAPASATATTKSESFDLASAEISRAEAIEIGLKCKLSIQSIAEKLGAPLEEVARIAIELHAKEVSGTIAVYAQGAIARGRAVAFGCAERVRRGL